MASWTRFLTNEDCVDWPAFFRTFDAIALIANSPAANLEEAAESLPTNTLFIFFNDVARVLAGNFDRHAILVTRSGRNGSAVVRKKKLGGLVAKFAPDRFHGVVNLRILDTEKFDPPSSLPGLTSARLDLIDFFSPTYPTGKAPSSGFAIAIWLEKMALEKPLFVIGFTGMRTERRKVFDSHDWTFEQITLRLMSRKGRIILQPKEVAKTGEGLCRVQTVVPDATLEEVVTVAAEVLSDRVNNLAYFVDRLWAVTKLARWASISLAFLTGRKQERR